MRAIILAAILCLSACNQTSTGFTQADVDVAVNKAITPLQQALAAATHAEAMQAIQLNKIQLEAPQGSIPGNSLTRSFSAINFGPCPDGGIKSGQTGIGSDEQTQVFKQATTATCPGVYSEYDVATGNLHATRRLYYLTANCTGTSFVWDAGGQGIDRQKTEAGVSFMSPNTEGQMWVAPGTKPVLTQVQSVFFSDGSGCLPDGDLQPMWLAKQTTTNESGVALNLGPDYQLNGL